MKNTNFTFNKSDNYKEKFFGYVKALNFIDDLPYEEKVVIADRLIENYVNQTGERPDYLAVDRLNNWLLKRENVNGDFKSERQLRRIRQEKEFAYAEIQSDDRHMSVDGNKVSGVKPNMDSEKSHSVKVVMPSDLQDLRKYNGPLMKYFEEFLH